MRCPLTWVFRRMLLDGASTASVFSAICRGDYPRNYLKKIGRTTKSGFWTMRRCSSMGIQSRGSTRDIRVALSRRQMQLNVCNGSAESKYNCLVRGSQDIWMKIQKCLCGIQCSPSLT